MTTAEAIKEIEEYINDADKAISDDEEYIRGWKSAMLVALEVLWKLDANAQEDNMTNKAWLSTLPSNDFYDTFKKVEHTEALWCTDSRWYMIDWLDKEHVNKTEPMEAKHEALCMSTLWQDDV